MTGFRLWMRWSWRDLRRRWLLVTAIALVIALGTGTYAGLLSTSAWRRQSNDASFALLHTHDLRVALPQGASTGEGSLLALLPGIAHAGDITAARERLVVPTQLAGPHGLLVSGELVGTDTRPGLPVDGVAVTAGRGLAGADDGAPTVLAEATFARKNNLLVPAELTMSGGTRLRVVGAGQSPEYFLVTGGQGGMPFLSQKSYGVLFASLHTAQQVTGAAGRVNDLVLTLRPGADRDSVRQELRQALETMAPPLAATVSTRDDIDAYRILYDDIDGDAQLWRVIALLVLLGAALNLTSRVVAAQRREIGIGMALGVPSRLLAVRPLLFGAQIALLGVGLGMLVGWALGIPLRGVFVDLLPLRIWRTPLQVDMFAQAAALGFALPFAAVAWPVWRALRVQPVQAIRVGHLAARGGGLAPLLRRLRLPGHGYRQIPMRNVLRTPRRTALTALGIAAAITTLVTHRRVPRHLPRHPGPGLERTPARRTRPGQRHPGHLPAAGRRRGPRGRRAARGQPRRAGTAAAHHRPRRHRQRRPCHRGTPRGGRLDTHPAGRLASRRAHPGGQGRARPRRDGRRHAHPSNTRKPPRPGCVPPGPRCWSPASTPTRCACWPTSTPPPPRRSASPVPPTC